MKINSDGAEIENAKDMEVYGDWIKFVDDDGSIVKIAPYALKKLMLFALDNMAEFGEGAWV